MPSMETASPARPPVPVWEQNGHFRVGDLVQFPPDDDFAARVVWVEGKRVGILTNPANGAQCHASRSETRHLQDCGPCVADAAAQAAAEEEREDAYWGQWPDEDNRAHQAVMDDLVLTGTGPRRYRFGDRSPVREFMRTELDGHLLDDDAPSLSLGRVGDPLDWPRIEDEHRSDGLTLDNPWGTVPWPTIRTAFEILRDAGAQPALDVSVEMNPLADGTIGAEILVSELFVERHVDAATYERVVVLLGDATEFPHCHTSTAPAGPGGPGPDHTKPYTPHTYGTMRWNWSGGAWMSPFNPPVMAQV